MQGRIYDPTVGRFLTADPIVQSPFWSQGLNRYAYVFNSPMNLVDPSGFSAIGDYFQGLEDAPPEQAIPGYIGTGLVAGLAAAAIYEGVSASFAAGTASTVSTAATQSGGWASAGPYVRGAGAATVAIQRIRAATEPSITRETGEVPTRSTTRPAGAGKAHAIGQSQGGDLFSERPRGPSLFERGALADNGAGGASSADGGSEGNNGTGHYAPIIDDGGAAADGLMCVVVPEARVVQVVVRAAKAAKVIRALRAAKKIPLPSLKSSPFGPKIADAIPRKGVPRNWTPEQIEDAIADYTASISTRKAELKAFDEVGGSAIQRLAHARRITQEESFLRSLKKALGR